MKNLPIKKNRGPAPYEAKGFRSGFTIIEVMIAVALFTAIAIFGIGALLRANEVHNQNQKVRSIMDNLSFIMEDMSRNLRTGTEINCDGGTDNNSGDCTNGNVITFTNNNAGGDTWEYAIIANGSSNFNKIIKITQDNKSVPVEDISPLNPAEVEFDDASSFTVTGADPNDTLQPYIKIKLSGKIKYQSADVTTFSLQTSVSQRAIDVPSTP